jgi:hypothetical protein
VPHKQGALAHTFTLFSTHAPAATMSPFAAPSLTPLPESPFLAELTLLATASSTVDSKAIADSIALSLKRSPGVLEATQKAKIIDVVIKWSGSKSGYAPCRKGSLSFRTYPTLLGGPTKIRGGSRNSGKTRHSP